jgi:hypothetical protein
MYFFILLSFFLLTRHPAKAGIHPHGLAVIPAKAGIQLVSSHYPPTGWIPAFAGMTVG